MKKLKITFVILLSLFTLIFFILRSNWTKQLAIHFLSHTLEQSGFDINVEHIGGTFPHAITLSGLRIESDALRISADSLQISLSLLAFLKAECLLTTVKGSGISWEQKESIANQSIHVKIPFALSIQHFELFDVAIPHYFKANFEGSLRIKKKNRGGHLRLTARRSEYPNSIGHLILSMKNKGILQATGFFKTPTLAAASNDLALDGACDVQFTIRCPLHTLFDTQADLRGRVFGTFSPHLPTLNSHLKPWIETNWKGSIQIQKNTDWTFPRISLASEQTVVKAAASLTPFGQLKMAHMQIKIDNPQIEGSVEVETIEEKSLAVKTNVSMPLLAYNLIHVEMLHWQTDALWTQNGLNGDSRASANYRGQSWDATTHFSWNIGKAIILSKAMLQGPATHLSGEFEITKDHLLIGHTDLTIQNLQDLPWNTYGNLEASVEWSAPEQIQTAVLEGKGSEIYWHDLFGKELSFHADLIHPFDQMQGTFKISAENVKWKQLSIQTVSLDTQSLKEHWPFHLTVAGQWHHPIALECNGFWRLKNQEMTCSFQYGSGTFYNHPFQLLHPTTILYSSEQILCDALDLALIDALASFHLDQTKEYKAMNLSLTRFPLDLLSLNPLDIKINGQTNCTISLRENDDVLQGSMKATIEQVEISALDTPPIEPASGQIEGHYSKDQLALKGDLNIGHTTLLRFDTSLPIHLEIFPLFTMLLPEGSMNGQVTFDGHVEQILDFFDLGTHRIEGECTCNLTLQGTPLHPNINGSARCHNGYYENYLTGTRLFEIEAEGSAHGEQFILHSLTAQDETKKGTFTASGTIAFHPFEHFPFLFDIDFSNLQFVQIDLVSAEANGRIQVTGNLQEAIAKGEANITQSQLTIPNHIPRPLPDLSVVYLNAAKPIISVTPHPPIPYPLALDLHVQAPDGILIEGRGLQSEWKGTFEIGGTYTSIAAKGKLELMKGHFIFAGRVFQLLDGSLTFSGKEKSMPYLNLAAGMQVKDVSITARLKGPLNRPQITLQSNPPLQLSTIMSYLLFGQQLTEISSFQALQLVNSLASLSGETPDVLENTRKSLGVDRLQLVSIAGEKEDPEDTIALQVGKYVSEGILVSYTQGAEDASGNISIEMELKNGFVLQLESDQRQEQGKLTIKWNHNY